MIDERGIESAFYTEMGHLLTDRRNRAGFTQSALAAELGVHRNTVFRWESGEAAVPTWELMRIADVLSCNHSMLIPAKGFTWGRDYHALQRERENIRKPVQSERDPFVSDAEIGKLRRA